MMHISPPSLFRWCRIAACPRVAASILPVSPLHHLTLPSTTGFPLPPLALGPPTRSSTPATFNTCFRPTFFIISRCTTPSPQLICRHLYSLARSPAVQFPSTYTSSLPKNSLQQPETTKQHSATLHDALSTPTYTKHLHTLLFIYLFSLMVRGSHLSGDDVRRPLSMPCTVANCPLARFCLQF